MRECVLAHLFDMSDVLFLLPSQKSFSLVLEALDHDNDTSESG